MTLRTAEPPATPRPPDGTRGLLPSGWPPAGAVLASTAVSLTGLAWDLQWHDDVGPDTFFTLPHLFIYTGIAIAGLASLAVVLATTAAARAGRAADPAVGGRAVGVFRGTFAAPLGYLVTGTGAAAFLLYGLWDQWWHGLYGFDAVIDSPPHIGLLLSVSITMVGTVLVFAAARGRRWSAPGLVAIVTVLLACNTVTTIGLSPLDGAVNATTVGLAFLTTLLVLLTASAVRRPGALVGVAALLGALQAAFWWFAPVATRWYADVEGLPLRDNLDGVPTMASLLPMCLLPVCLVVEMVLYATRRRGWSTRLVTPVVGGFTGLVVAACSPVQDSLVYGSPIPGLPWPTVVAGLVAGTLAGFLGWQLGTMVRAVAPTTSTDSTSTDTEAS